jgi:hypothetical protein
MYHHKSKLRSELSVNGLQIDNDDVSVNRLQIERKVTRNGTTYTMDAYKGLFWLMLSQQWRQTKLH